MKLLVLRGLPGSGKSAYAKNLMAGHQDKYKRINRDSLRDLLDNGVWSRVREKSIKKAEKALAELYLDTICTVIIDDTNLSESAMTMWQDFAKQHGVEMEVKDFTHVSVEECIKRDKHRSPRVGRKVIMRMWRDHLAPKVEPPVYDPSLRDVWISDLDGSLCIHDGRSPYDAAKCESDLINESLRTILNNIRAPRHVILLSGRDDEFRPHTERWLAAHEVEYDALYMRKAGDRRRDDIVKEELYNEHVRGKWNVVAIFDDRLRVCRLWDRLGLPLFRIGNPDADF
jgi:predicted kinase